MDKDVLQAAIAPPYTCDRKKNIKKKERKKERKKEKEHKNKIK